MSDERLVAFRAAWQEIGRAAVRAMRAFHDAGLCVPEACSRHRELAQASKMRAAYHRRNR